MDESSDEMEFFSESSDDINESIDALNDEITELEQQVEYYKNKSNLIFHISGFFLNTYSSGYF